MVKVYYDAGHGYNTPGKRTPDGEREWTFNNAVAVAFHNELTKYENVQLVRVDDATGKTDVALQTRTNKANQGKADYYFSFHHNANTSKWGTWTGVETFIYSFKDVKSYNLAKAIQPALVKAYGLRDRGIKEGNLHIVRETKMPAVLIEGGFMDSTIDIKKLRDSKVLKNAGILVAQAFAKYVGLKLKTVKPVEQTKKPATQTTPSANTTGTVKVLVDNLNYYNGPRWTNPTGTVKKNTVLTVVGKVKVEGVYQYKLKSGTYITASEKYVKFTAK